VKNERLHEQKLVRWLETIQKDATEIFLVGDIFDFWFEYRKVVPKGFSRLLGKLCEITDSGIPVHFFVGNHDLWTFGYLKNEIGLIVHKTPEILILNGKKTFIAHGDGLNDTDNSFKFVRKIFHCKFLQHCFGLINPNIGIAFGQRWSNLNRLKHDRMNEGFKGENNEQLVLFAKKMINKQQIDYFILGHRHITLNLQIAKNSQIAILGDFIREFSYAVLDNDGLKIEYF
jgi:UDP-2,3-diacylglucosamine hydrolase